jgi:signal transduction histidine kinase
MRILLIEDDPEDALLMRDYLEDAELDAFELVRVERLEQAVVHLGEHNSQVDIALLDLNLPDSRGLDTLRALVGATHDVPVVVVTGLEDEDVALAAVNLGAQDYLVKGAVDEDIIRRTIRYAIERHRLERERSRLAAELSDAQKMKTVGLLAGGIAHDFNNMLTVIIGHCRLIRAEVSPRSHMADSVEAIQTAGERAAELSRRLLALGREPIGAPGAVDANSIVYDVNKLLGRVIGSHVRLELKLHDGLWCCVGERAQLTQVLVNLAVNARDAMADGGTLTIETSNSPAGEGRGEGQEHVCISVSDTGHGIDADAMSRIFEPFFTTKAKGVGTGLGLASVLAIVERFGGGVTVSSEVGVGTRFSVLLPRCERPPLKVVMPAEERARGDALVFAADDASVKEGEGRLSPASDPRERALRSLLVVDDDPLVGVVLEASLRREGYDVVLRTELSRAIDALECMHVDAVVTDVNVPGGGGVRLLEAVRAHRRGRSCPVVAISGDSRLRQQMLEAGFDAFYSKPVDVKEISLGLLSLKERLLHTPP